MSRVGVRSEALAAAARRCDTSAEGLRVEALAVLVALRRCRPPPGAGGLAVLPRWVALEARGVAAAGPGGLLGAAAGLELLAVRLRAAGRLYQGVEAGVAAVMRSVSGAADLAAGGGWLTDARATPSVRAVAPRWTGASFGSPADLVAAGEGLDGGRVRVVEVACGTGGSAWVVVVPGTQRWSPRAGPDPFDLTTDVRAVTGGEVTLAAAGVAAALDRARAASGRAAPDDPVLLVGHSQGGILAAGLAADPGFARRHHVTHVLTTGAPVGLFPVPATVRVLSVEHRDDPVPGLDLTPNPSRPSWVTVRAGEGPALDVRRHALAQYVSTTAAAAAASPGAVPGVAAWRSSAGAFLGRPVRSVTEVVLERGWQNPRP